MKAWMETLKERMRAAFGERVLFIGLQGSRARGEATIDSDIDVVVVLDTLGADDIRLCRAVLGAMPEGDKICGFFSGRAELAAWERGDLFQFVRDTTAFYGDLADIVALPGREEARRAALSGACNIYHGCVHNLLFDRDAGILRELYKAAGFALRAKHFWRTGAYCSRSEELAAALPAAEAAVLAGRETARALRGDGESFERASNLLLDWAGQTIREMGEANQNNTETRLRLNP
ncbi:MAG TPA: nucleotidyltransferase domain-containing protein [Candidatus Pullichristensenella avicola]|nr:nucleotidyltransferase domain-containing protein [Candidatus Pullichristensenella avicola]